MSGRQRLSLRLAVSDVYGQSLPRAGGRSLSPVDAEPSNPQHSLPRVQGGNATGHEGSVAENRAPEPVDDKRPLKKHKTDDICGASTAPLQSSHTRQPAESAAAHSSPAHKAAKSLSQKYNDPQGNLIITTTGKVRYRMQAALLAPSCDMVRDKIAQAKYDDPATSLTTIHIAVPATGWFVALLLFYLDARSSVVGENISRKLPTAKAKTLHELADFLGCGILCDLLLKAIESRCSAIEILHWTYARHDDAHILSAGLAKLYTQATFGTGSVDELTE